MSHVLGRVVVTGKIPQPGLDLLVGADHDVVAWDESHPISRDELLRRVAGADVIVNATSGEVSLAVLGAAGAESLRDKVVIDIANPLDFSGGFPPTLSVKDTDSLGEQIQAAFP